MTKDKGKDKADNSSRPNNKRSADQIIDALLLKLYKGNEDITVNFPDRASCFTTKLKIYRRAGWLKQQWENKGLYEHMYEPASNFSIKVLSDTSIMLTLPCKLPGIAQLNELLTSEELAPVDTVAAQAQISEEEILKQLQLLKNLPTQQPVEQTVTETLTDNSNSYYIRED